VVILLLYLKVRALAHFIFLIYTIIRTLLKVVGFEYSFFKIGVLYLQWTKRTGKQKHPSRRVHFLLQKNTGNDERQIMTSKEVVRLALFSCHQPKAEDDDPELTQKAKG